MSEEVKPKAPEGRLADLPPDLGPVPWKEIGGLLLGIVLLALVYYWGNVRSWGLEGVGWAPEERWAWMQRWDRFVWFGLNFVLLFGVPALVIRFWWRQPLRDYGLALGKPAIWLRYLLVYGLVMVPVVLLASRLPSLQDFYPLYRPARTSAVWFLAAAGGWLVYFFAWEFFFRGFLLNLLAVRYGGLAIVVQTIPFVMMHFPKPAVETFAAIIAGLTLGLMAYRGRSFLGAWALHWFVAISLDLLVVVWR